MGEISKIAWTRSTYNHWWVCTEYGPGCDSCYAREFAGRMGWKWGKGAPRRFFGEKHNHEPYHWNKKAEKSGEEWRVFAMSMADWADEEVPEEKRLEFFKIVKETPSLTWLLLTKRAALAKTMLPPDWGPDGYPNVRFGVTCVNQKEADRDIPKLLTIPARSYWISAEPQIEEIDYSQWLPVKCGCRSVAECFHNMTPTLDQIVTGGESGNNPRPYNLAWARSTVKQCRDSGAAAFVKQLGSCPVVERWPKQARDFGNFGRVENLKLKDGHGANPEEWPADLRVREFPT